METIIKDVQLNNEEISKLFSFKRSSNCSADSDNINNDAMIMIAARVEGLNNKINKMGE